MLISVSRVSLVGMLRMLALVTSAYVDIGTGVFGCLDMVAVDIMSGVVVCGVVTLAMMSLVALVVVLFI